MPAIIVTIPAMQKAILKIIFRFITVLTLFHAGQQNIDLPFKQALVILNSMLFARFIGKDEIVQIMRLTVSASVCRSTLPVFLNQLTACDIPVFVKLPVKGTRAAIKAIPLDVDPVE